MEIPAASELHNRTASVLNSIYLLFNEGYNSTHSGDLIRKDLMSEAMLLCKMLTENEHTRLPETFALMALMCFHSARTDGRVSDTGEIILLAQQDRSKWDDKMIEEGNRYMNEAAFGDKVSAYHLEAAIAFEHCIAENYESTNWIRILELYTWLCQVNPSEIAEINKAVVIFKLHGAPAALIALQNMKDNAKANGYYLYHSLLGEIYATQHDSVKAAVHFKLAIDLTKSEAEKKLLREKMSTLFS